MKKFVIAAFFVSGLLSAQTPVNYTTQIVPLFQSYGCNSCHGGSGGFFITPYSAIFSSGNHKPVVVAGDTNSVLIKKLKGTAGFGARMPIGGDQIADSDLSLIVRWVKEGAKETPTLIKQEISPVAAYQLNQNFPNPFNPSTKILFSIGQTERVTLTVFDLLGKEVVTLINQSLTAGGYEVDFSAASIPSGIYLYKLETASYSEVRKMTVLK